MKNRDLARQFPQVRQHLVQRPHIREAGLDIKQRENVGCGRAVPTHSRTIIGTEAKALGVGRRRANAGAGAATCNQDGVDTTINQITGQVG